MNLHRAFTPRPTPQLPDVAEFVPCYDAIPRAKHSTLPTLARVLRPLYWWATDLAAHGVRLQALRYDEDTVSAVVAARMPSYRVVQVIRRQDGAARRPQDLLTLLAEAVWRCGALGWGAELGELSELLAAHGVLVEPNVVRRGLPIPGLAVQPVRAVRVAYWWAQALRDRGWVLHQVGSELAAGGFIALVPGDDVGDDPVLAVYPAGMADDGTEASALADLLSRMTVAQLRDVGRVIADAAPEPGQIS